ncbi:MAG TPA: type II toxin-antitoxin system prevent-host-death family antitoxin [Syntrophaceae bacterium]|nr:type II toxin-antitoxin system prevent-host-death family antitoxin [Syntrophaceae bacterium]
MQPITVGVRDAKINLSKLLKMVQQGSEIILTDRGRPVGKIVPIKTESLPLLVRIKHLEDQGVIEPPSGKGQKKIPPPIPLLKSMAQRFLQEDREDAER